MPRKTKETNEEIVTTKTAKAAAKKTAKVEKKNETKKTAKKSSTSAKKEPAKKAVKSDKTAKKEITKKVTKSDAKKTAKSSTKKVAEKKSTKSVKKADSKATTKAASKTARKTTKKSDKTVSKSTSTRKKSTKSVTPSIVEYYDLPYKYNQTVVKVLYQNPTTLFVYWEISDDDMAHYKELYGENFFDTTRPVLVVYNETMNYSFEVDINDFANSWYFNINDSKCDYRIELIRRPVFYNEKIKTDYIYITSSNKINTPNDRILFSTNEPNIVYFKNTKNNIQRKVNLPKLLEKLNVVNKDVGFPIIRNVCDLYENVYHIEDVGEFSVSLTNPSSRGGNPSSHSLSSRFTY